jgi:hypothetical protein
MHTQKLNGIGAHAAASAHNHLKLVFLMIVSGQ